MERVEAGDGRVRVTFSAEGRSVTAIVRSQPVSHPRRLTCYSELPSRPGIFELLED
jgi:hypothetical protein